MQLCFVSAIENEAQNNQGLGVMDKIGVKYLVWGHMLVGVKELDV